MKALDIKITKAKIKSFMVTLGEDAPEVTTSISLLTDGGKEITSYSISSSHWQENLKFDLPFSIVPPIKEIADVLERIVSEHCQSSCLMLEQKSEL